MQKLILSLGLALAAMGTANAAESHHDHMMAQAGAAPAASTAAMSEGEVRKVDKGAKKITIKHGELKNLGMPPMTMVFQVKDPAFLDQVKAGDKVRFSAEDANGALLITSIQVAN